MNPGPIIGFDSNVLTAFLLANNGKPAERETDPLAPERLATYRLFLYCRPFVLPSVTVEAGLIPDGAKLEEHLRFIAFTFAELNPDDYQQERIKERAAALKKFHSGDLDCQIVAEAEVGAATAPHRTLELLGHPSGHTFQMDTRFGPSAGA